MIKIRPQVERPKPNEKTLQIIKGLESPLKKHVYVLAEEIGERTVFIPENLLRTADYIKEVWEEMGHAVKEQAYEVHGQTCSNLWVEIKGKGKSEEIIVVGAHYDSVNGSPGANDNGSGVAALLEISRLFGREPRDKTIRFVAFPNEEPPFFQGGDMGSRVYARHCREKEENIVGMICLETIGYYSDKPRSQNYPPPLSLFYPNKGNFIAVVGNMGSQKLVRSFTGFFMAASDFPVECASVPGFITGIDWSDHSSFWRHGYPALMVTDTALYRYPYYHLATDLPVNLDYPSLARVTHGLYWAILKMVE